MQPELATHHAAKPGVDAPKNRQRKDSAQAVPNQDTRVRRESPNEVRVHGTCPLSSPGRVAKLTHSKRKSAFVNSVADGDRQRVEILN
ncbi:hypothetical protein GCM10009540_10360 [Streptomyces turgidiscabies]|nr:hypothetical protein T45_03398 [Streptomyces turgidiscabies]